MTQALKKSWEDMNENADVFANLCANKYLGLHWQNHFPTEAHISLVMGPIRQKNRKSLQDGLEELARLKG